MANKPKTNYKTDKYQLNPKDRCITPPYAVTPLLPYLRQIATGPIWESAVGDGAIGNVLIDRGFQVIGTDLDQGAEFNYFEYRPEGYVSAQVTNPPFGLKYAWLDRAYDLGIPFALLMPLEVLGALRAQKLFERSGVEVILLDSRVDFRMPNKGWDGSGAQFPVAWFTHGLKIGAPLVYGKIAQEKKEFKARMRAISKAAGGAA